MNLSEFCAGEVVSIDEHASLQAAAELMSLRCVGCLVVTSGASGRLLPVGVVTDRDLVTRALRFQSDLTSLDVSSAMSHRVVALLRTDSVEDVFITMLQNRVRRVVIKDSDHSVCGIISIDDLIVKLSQTGRPLGLELKALADLVQIQDGTLQRRRTHEFTRMA